MLGLGDVTLKENANNKCLIKIKKKKKKEKRKEREKEK
jgi:hypothetical protein